MLREFKEFALKGNMVDMALGFIVASSFGNVIMSLVGTLLIPRLQAARSGNTDALAAPVDYSALITSLVSFLVLSLIVFIIVKAINAMKRGEDTEPVEKECHYCFYSVPIQATRCGHCTSQIEEIAVT